MSDLDTIRIREEYKRRCYIATLSVYCFMQDDAYIAYCPSLDLVAYGYSQHEAITAFDTTARIYFEDVIERGLLVEDLRRLGWSIRSKKQRKTQAPSDEVLRSKREQYRELLTHQYERVERQLSIAA